MNKIQELRKSFQERLNQLKIGKVKVNSAEVVPAYTPENVPEFVFMPVPECCRVKLELAPEQDSYIRVELWLPTDCWNGMYLGTGNAGGAGFIIPHSLINGTARGYATANTDLGTFPGVDTLIGKASRWKDFGYRATHLMTVAAKELIEVFYGQKPKYSFFVGTSTGGQQALKEAQDFPEDYDGIVAVCPAYNRIRLHTSFVRNWQILKRRRVDFGQREAEAVSRRIIEVYAGESGGKSGDPYLTEPGRISVDYGIFQELIKQGTLTEQHVEALKELHEDVRNPRTGELIYPGMTVGSERFELGIPHINDKEAFAEGSFFPMRWPWGKDFDFMTFDFDKDFTRITEEMSPVLDATETDLSAFRNAGGKLLLVSGSTDPIIPCRDTTNYYEAVLRAMGGKANTEDFLSYYFIPGLGHVDGPCVQDVGVWGLAQIPKDREHDMLECLRAWVTQGVKPGRMRLCSLENASRQGKVVGEKEVHPYHR